MAHAHTHVMPRRTRRRAVVSARRVAFAVAAVAALAVPAGAAADGYVQRNLVSDVPGLAQVTDPHLVNPWGLAASPTSPLWVANNGTSTSTLYRGAVPGNEPVTIVPLVVDIAGAPPTGAVFNSASPAFPVSNGTASAPSVFLFSTFGGTVNGWNPSVTGTTAVVGGRDPGAVYTGLALASNSAGSFVYAADFAGGKIDVYDSTLTLVSLAGGFVDPQLPEGYSPFNVQTLGSRIYVAYAKVDPATGEEDAGSGLGFVDVYTTRGVLVKRLISHDHLNAPWGLALAPNRFGEFSRALLVGNFGNGRIHAYDRNTGAFLGTIATPSGRPLVNDELWGIRFGNGTFGTPQSLIFAAGIDEEQHGLVGVIEAAG